MPAYTSEGYRVRAGECVRLANLTADAMLQADLLKLRQTYLVIAARLRPGPVGGPAPLEQPAA